MTSAERDKNEPEGSSTASAEVAQQRHQIAPSTSHRPKRLRNTIELERSTIPKRVAASIRERIASGELVPGTRLIEVDLTYAYGVSRHTLREAISLLVGERLVTRTSFKGFEITRLVAADVRDIYAARRAIELSAVDLLPHAPPEYLAAVKSSISQLIDLPDHADGDTMHRADTAVHTALVASHQSRRLSEAHTALMAELNILLFKTYGARDKALAVERHGLFGHLIDKGRFVDARSQLEARLRASEHQIAQASDLASEPAVSSPALR